MVVRRGRALLRSLRASLPGLPGAVIGWEISAALALGDALGVPPLAMADLLPVIEAAMERAANAEIAGSGA